MYKRQDLVRTGETGYLADYKDVDDLANGIEWVFGDEQRYQMMSKRSRTFVEEYCSYASVAQKHQQILTRILNESVSK